MRRVAIMGVGQTMLFPKGTKILIVEDTSTMRIYLKELLRSLGYEVVVEATDGRDAAAKLALGIKEGKPYGLVLSNWSMPEMTGLELLRFLRTRTPIPSTPFIMVTSRGCERDIRAAIQFGAHSYLIKPVTQETLAKNLRDTFQLLNKAKKAA